MSNEANLAKLLRTLTRYEAKLLILAPQHPPKLKVAEGWHSIEEHPELSSQQIEEEARALLGTDFEKMKDEEKIVQKKIGEENLEFEWGQSQNGSYLMVRKSEPARDLSDHPLLKTWLQEKGILVVSSKALYAAVIKRWSQYSKDVAVSLERESGSSASYLGLVLNLKWGEDFLEVEEGLRKALNLSASMIGIKELPLQKEEQSFLGKFAKTGNVLIYSDVFHPVSFEGKVLFLN